MPEASPYMIKLYHRGTAAKTAWTGQNQTWRSMEQNREPGYRRGIQLQPPGFMTNMLEIYTEEKTVSSKNSAGKTGYSHAES